MARLAAKRAEIVGGSTSVSVIKLADAVAASAGGDEFSTDVLRPTFLYVHNGGAGSINVTLRKAGYPDRVVAVAAGARMLIRVLGAHSVSYSAVTSVSVLPISY